MKDFKTLQKKAERAYLVGLYKEAKLYNEQALLLTRKGTRKYIETKSRILDCQIHLDTDSAISETDVMKLRDNLNEIL